MYQSSLHQKSKAECVVFLQSGASLTTFCMKAALGWTLERSSLCKSMIVDFPCSVSWPAAKLRMTQSPTLQRATFQCMLPLLPEEPKQAVGDRMKPLGCSQVCHSLSLTSSVSVSERERKLIQDSFCTPTLSTLYLSRPWSYYTSHTYINLLVLLVFLTSPEIFTQLIASHLISQARISKTP